jgi:hypothetical protein
MASPTLPRTGRPSRQGLIELLLVVGFLSVAAAGAVALFGDELRHALGARPAREAARPP